ncbi:MAG TPA: class I SAM-dependent methyltransferase [Caldilineae bacterium]|nr:class I SAM-dependent methyltransferase [Caldilineae bacterium]
MTKWHDDDTFWEQMRDRMFHHKRWEATSVEIDHVLALLNLPAAATILDMPCGPGRHALELARRGFRVTGVDRTVAYLDEARERAQEAGVNVEWIKADMRDFHLPGMFDAAINLFTSFGYFEDPAEDRQVAENFFTSLKPGGQLLMDMMGKEVLARIFRERDWHEEEDGTLFLEERQVTQNWSWIENRWIAIRGRQRVEFHLGHRLYSAAELTALLTSVGFTNVSAYGSLAGDPYDHTARRLVVLAHKPE